MLLRGEQLLVRARFRQNRGLSLELRGPSCINIVWDRCTEYRAGIYQVLSG